jgi:L-asparaginase II
VLVEVRRGDVVESRHHVRVAVVGVDGGLVRAWGDADAPVLPRSSVKPVQALPLLTTGAAERFGLDDRHLALACASHRGEPAHVTLVRQWLEQIGLDESALECGVQDGRASALHHNCSGQHTSFLATAVHLGEDPLGYVEPDHPVQQRARHALARVLGIDDLGEPLVDGCGIPVFAVPLRALATSLVRLGIGGSDDPDHAAAGRRLVAAMRGRPWWLDGSAQVVTDLVIESAGRAVTKYGAEGVEVAAWPDAGLGLALKAHDGARRAVEVALAGVLATLAAERPEVPGSGRILSWGRRMADRPVVNGSGRVVGSVRAVVPLSRGGGG